MEGRTRSERQAVAKGGQDNHGKPQASWCAPLSGRPEKPLLQGWTRERPKAIKITFEGGVADCAQGRPESGATKRQAASAPTH